MAKKPSKRIPLEILNEDRETALKLQSLPDYTPRNQVYSVTSLQQLVAELNQAEAEEVVAQRALEVARERAIEAGIKLHNATNGAKIEVLAQFGDDSPALSAVGRKRRSDRSRPVRRQAPEA